MKGVVEFQLMARCCQCQALLSCRSSLVGAAPNLMQKRYFNQKRQTHYDVLRVPKDATLQDIREAFVKLSKETHPDQNPGDPKSGEKFAKIMEAYRVLSKPSLRKDYDVRSTVGNMYRSTMTAYPYRGNVRDMTPGEREWEELYRRAHYNYSYTQEMKPKPLFSLGQIFMGLAALMSLGFLMAAITIGLHYRGQKSAKDRMYRQTQADYRHHQAMIIALGREKHQELLASKITAEIEERERRKAKPKT